MPDEDEWRYHQDGRDSAMAMGCFAVACIIVCGIVIVLTAAIVG